MRAILRKLATNDPLSALHLPAIVSRVLYVGAYAVLILFVLVLFVRTSGVNKNPDATLQGMVSGSAGRPYVYRMLLPSIARAVSAVTPDAIENRVEAGLPQCSLGRSFLKHFRVTDGYGYEGLVVVSLMLAALIGYAVFLFLLSSELPVASPGGRHVAPVLGLLALPPFFVFGYIYDFPVLFFITCCLYLLSRQRFFLYFVMFTLACINKETTIVLLVGYAAFFYSVLPSRKFILHGVIQLVLFLAVKGLVEWWFRDNPGTVMIVTAEAQFATLMSGFNYSRILLGAFLFLVLGYHWSAKSRFVKQSLWMFAPLLLLFMLGSCPGEYRVFYEVLPVGVLLAADTLVRTVFSSTAPGCTT